MINKEKILAGTRACINPNISNCQECPYWNNGNKQCEELRLDICDALYTAINAIEQFKRAEWIPNDVYYSPMNCYVVNGYTCSNCKTKVDKYTNYCSYCGAKMEVKDKMGECI